MIQHILLPALISSSISFLICVLYRRRWNAEREELHRLLWRGVAMNAKAMTDPDFLEVVVEWSYDALKAIQKQHRPNEDCPAGEIIRPKHENSGGRKSA